MASIFQVVIRSLEDYMPVDFAVIAPYNADERVITVAHLGVKSRPIAVAIAMPEQTRIPVDENGLARAVKGELVYEADIAGASFSFPSRLAGGGLRSLVIAPLLIGEQQSFGVLIVARREADELHQRRLRIPPAAQRARGARRASGAASRYAATRLRRSAPDAGRP